MTTELAVALRVQPKLDDARRVLRELKGELNSLKQASQSTASAVGAAGAGQPAADVERDAKRASQAVGQLSAANSQSAAAAREAARAYTEQLSAINRVAREEANKAAAEEREAAAALKAAEANRQNRDAVAKLLAQIDPAERALQRMDERERQLSAALKSGAIDAEQYAKSMKLVQASAAGGAGTHAAMRRIGVETATARREVMALGREIVSGSFSRIPSALIGVADSTNLLSVAFGRAINPVTLLAAAIVAVGTAYAQGISNQRQFNLATAATGSFAGMTRDRLIELGQQAADVSNITSRAAQQAALAMTASGRLGGETIANLTKSVGTFAEITGQSSEQATAALMRIFENPKQGAEELDKSLHFLSLNQLKYIDNLVKSGNTEQAQLALSRELYTYLQDSGVTTVDSLTKKWISLKNAMSEGWDQFTRRISGTITTTEKIADIEERMRARRYNMSAEEKAEYLAERKALQDQLDQENRATAAKQAQTEAEDRRKKAYAEYQSVAASYRPAEEKRLEDLGKLKRALDLGSISQQEYNKAVADINRKANRGRGRSGTGVAGAQVRADLQALKEAFQQSDALIVRALEDGRVSINEAYQRRLDALHQRINSERQVLAAELDNRKTSPQRRIEIQAKINGLDAELAKSTRAIDAEKRKWEQQLANVTIKLRLDIANITGQFDRDAIEQQLRLQYADVLKAIDMSTDPADVIAGHQLADALMKASAAQAEFNAKLEETSRLQSQLGVVEQAIQQQVSSGQISQIEGQAKINQARAAQVPVLQQIVRELERIRDAVPPEAAAAIDRMSTSIGTLRNQVAATTPVVVNLGTRLRNTMIDGTADAAANAITNFENLGQAASNVLKQIAADIVRSNIKQLLTNLFTPNVGGGGGSIFGSIFGGIGSVFGFAEGGLIRGPGTGTSDSIPALVGGMRPIRVSNGEFIQNERAVQHYGLPFMEAIRTLRLPKPAFALGGLMSASRAVPRFANGGSPSAATAAPAGTPSIRVEVSNSDTPKRVTSATSAFEGKDLVVRIVTADAATNGPMTRALKGAMSRS
ncbi:phage tail length tape measure family protein [Burkholderia anthina]|uniref:phage tail length tape measure family protein n=1 Tax=Burkholderia anthina TaxID=179879 RepID=UPI00158D3E23|nr:phage tail length tape measure family protein [Burkholderia anthina]